MRHEALVVTIMPPPLGKVFATPRWPPANERTPRIGLRAKCIFQTR